MQNRLAQNLPLLALGALLISLATGVTLVASPDSPNATFSQLRTVIIVGVWASVLLVGGLVGWAFTAPLPALEQRAQQITRFSPSLAGMWVVLILLLALNVALAVALRDVAPSIVAPLRHALIGFSALWGTMSLIIHWHTLQNAFYAQQTRWALFGASIAVLSISVLVYTLTQSFVIATGINDQLRGGLDYRQLTFIEGENQPTSQAFWQEQSKTRVRWLPYSYWTVAPIAGKYINISENGLRQTPDYAQSSPESPIIAIFGGSTVWGEGARDNYTIPAQLAKQLFEQNVLAHVVNYGQTGYVSAQDLILFQMQLINGNIPDVAIFYGGFNDVLSAYTQGISGITLQESARASDSENGRALRGGQALLSPIVAPLSPEALALTTVFDSTPEAVTTRYLNTLSLVKTLAEKYNVKVLFVWQPHILDKTPLVGIEQIAYERMETERAGFSDLYRQVDALVRTHAQAESDWLYLGDLFTQDERPLFYDLIHITEHGNLTVAESLLPTVIKLLKP